MNFVNILRTNTIIERKRLDYLSFNPLPPIPRIILPSSFFYVKKPECPVLCTWMNGQYGRLGTWAIHERE